MTQENTKLCDFSNTNNNYFVSTPIAPPSTSGESCDINTALRSHLNTFVELCDMQKKKDVDNDVVKMNYFRFLCVILQNFGFLLCLAIVSILGTSARMLLLLSIFHPQNYFP